MFKKALSILLAVMLVFSAFSMATVAAGAQETNAAANAKTEVAPVGADDTLTVKATSNLFPEKTYTFTQDELAANDNKVTVTYFINSEKDLLNTQWTLRFDGDKLAANEADNVTVNDDDETISTVMPKAADAVINFAPSDENNAIKGNCTKLGLYKLSKKGEQVGFVSVTFEAKGTGEAVVDLDVEELRVSKLQPGKTQTQDEDEEQLVDGSKVKDVTFSYTPVTSVYGGSYDASYTNPAEDPTEATKPTEAETTAEPVVETTAEPVVETTVEPETVVTTAAPETVVTTAAPEPATEATAPESDKLNVKVTSNLFGESTKSYDASTKQITVVYELNCPGYAIVNSDVEFTYDPDVFSYAEVNTDEGICPVAGSQFVCTTPETPLFGQEGLITGNFSNIMNQIKAYGPDGKPTTFFTVVFDVKDGAKGDTECNLFFKNFRIVPEDKLPETDSEFIIRKGVVDPEADLTKLNLNDYSTDGKEEPITEPATAEPTEPTEPTEPVEDKVYSIAGSSEEIFGAKWDASNISTDMTKGDDGLYTITFKDVQPADNIEFKVVVNHSWDESYGDKTGNNVKFNVVTPCDVTVTFNEETKEIKVIGDGVTQDTELIVEVVRAVGNGQDNWLNGSNWDPDDDINKMQQVAPGVYQIVFDDIDEDLNYQIKFAVNGGWANNFGAPEDGFVAPNRESFDATYNGKNIYVHVDEDGSKVIAVLDLTNFDYDTKMGAKSTITVIPPTTPTEPVVETTAEPVVETTAEPVVETTAEPVVETTAEPVVETTAEPVVETTAEPVVETTAEPVVETTAEPVVETTAEPVVETTAEPVVETTAEPVVETTAAPKLHVDTTSNFFEAKDLGEKEIGEEFTVSYNFQQPDEYKLVSGQWKFEYDADKVELIEANMPNTTGYIHTQYDSETGKTVTYGNFSDINGFDFSTEKEFVNAKFKAVNGGEETIKFVVVDLLNEEWAIVKDGVIQDKPEPEPTTAPAEPTTEPVVPTTVPGPVIGDNFTIVADNVNADLKAGETVKVPVSFVNNPADGYEYGYVRVNWNKDALELTSIEYNDALAPAQASAAPIENTGSYKVSFGNQTALETFKGDGEAFKLVFKITDAAVATNYALTLSEQEVYDFDINEIPADVVNGSVTLGVPAEPTTAPAEPTTAPAEPTTAPAEPTTAPAEPTTAPAEPTTAPAEPTTAPAEPTTAPAEPTTAPAEPTTAPAEPTTAPAEPTTAPEEATTAPVEPTSVEPTTEPGTSVEPTGSTDASSATKPATGDSATGDSASTSDSGSNGSSLSGGTNGAVQTGNASMAIIVLLVLVSATGAIYFARKRAK